MSEAPGRSCSACDAWGADSNSGLYSSDCDGCKARAIAGSPTAARAMSPVTEEDLQQAKEDLQQAVEAVFTQERYADGRRLVWQWIQKLKDARAAR